MHRFVFTQLKILLSIIIILPCYLFSSLPDLKISAVFDKPEYSFDDTVIVALQCKIPKNFHLYSNPLGPGIGKPFSLQVSSDNKIKWISAKKMQASKFQPEIGDWVWAYSNEAVFFVFGKPAANQSQPIHDTILIDALICENACIPVSNSIPLEINITGGKSDETSFASHRKLQKLLNTSQDMEFEIQQKNLQISPSLTGNLLISIPPADSSGGTTEEIVPEWDYSPVENQFEFSLFLALFFAFLAGIILNVMPCVLPVLGIKILSFSQGAGSSKRTAILRSIIFAAGMISIFLVLASLAAFAGLSWGEQFQKPEMLVAIICIIFVFALGMFDIFVILVPSGISQLEQKSATKSRFLDDFIKGMFTTVLATPCSGPLLGATLAWTLTKSPFIIYLIFFAIGLGMAFPYILFSSSTGLMKLIPKPGRWMENFKYIMGFLLFGFAVYLMIGLPKDMVLPTIGMCTVLGFSVILYTRYAPFGSTIKRKITVGIITLLITGAGIKFNFSIFYNFISEESNLELKSSSVVWENFSPKKLIDAHKKGFNVIIDFTANWCMNCQYNKIRVYRSKEVEELIKKKKIIPLKADLTKNNPEAESLMHHLGSRSVPFFAVFPGDDPYSPLIFRDIVRKRKIIDVLSNLNP